MALPAEKIDEADEVEVIEDTLLVMDETCKPQVRDGQNTHNVWYGGGPIPYTFKFREFLEMPREHAMRLVRIPEFHVKEHDGTRIQPTPDVKAGQVLPKLEVGQVVARLDELTNYALAMRANQYDGGDKMRATNKKEKLIDFLVEVQEGQKNASIAPRRIVAGMESEDGIVGED